MTLKMTTKRRALYAAIAFVVACGAPETSVTTDRTSPDYAESVALVGISADGSREISIRAARFPGRERGTLWLTVHGGGTSLSLGLDDLQLTPGSGPTPVETSDASFEVTGGATARFDTKDRHTAAMTGQVTAEALAHRTLHPSPGAGDLPVRIEASFEADDDGVSTRTGRLEVFGRVRATLETPDGAFDLDVPGKWHEQIGVRPRFAGTFTYFAAQSDDVALLARGRGNGQWGYLKEGREVTLVERVDIDAQGTAVRSFRVDLEDGRRVEGTATVLRQGSVPIEGQRRPGATVLVDSSVGAMVGHLNDWDPQSGPRLEALENLLQDETAGGFAGSVLVASGDEVIHLAGYGLADREAGVPFRPETVSTIGSITKQFTGAAILKLQEQGHLSVADPVGRFFPEAPVKKREITIHQLLTHTAGLPPALGSDEEYIGRDDYLQEVWRTELRYPPGERHDYSNTGYSVLAAIVERTTGSSYEEFLRAEFFDPLGMQHTGYRLADWSEARLATGYRDDRRFGTVIEKQTHENGFSWHLVGNGGIHSTVGDMFRWVKALRGGEVLSAESLGTLFGEHVDEGYGDSFYGYGWVTFRLPNSERMIGHNGGNGFFFADLNFFPNRGDLPYCVLMNDAGHEEVSGAIRRLLLELPREARSQEDPQ